MPLSGEPTIAGSPLEALLLPPQPAEALIKGSYRGAPEAFQVDEVPGWQPSGDGEHLLLRVRKRGANSAWVAGELARAAGCRPRDVGYCGSKDRQALTWQWFSVPDTRGLLEPAGWQGEGWQVLAVERHRRKLRRGEHAGNRFRLLLQLETPVEPAVLQACLARLQAGVPNYFGPQRFGRQGANLGAAAGWVESGRLTRDRSRRGWLISAARALLFNQVLAARVSDGSWNQCLSGESVLDGGPTGPMWGRGHPPVSAAALAVEQAALVPWQAWCERLEHVGLQQERRPLVLQPQAPQLERDGDLMRLAFTLPPGSFATAVLAALGALHELDPTLDRDAASDLRGQEWPD